MTDEAQKSAKSPWWLTILIGRRPKWTFIRIIALVVGCTILFKFVLLPVQIQGTSMLPTYRTGHVGLLNLLAYRSHEPQRGDIVFIRYAGKSVMLMKRIIGLPGETVAFVQGKLLINDQILPEPDVKSWCHWEMPKRQLGPGEYFVVGDNRAMSIDEHELGVAVRDRIVGKVLL